MGNFSILTSQSPLSWVSELFTQDIDQFLLLGWSLATWKVFSSIYISIMKNLTDFRKTVETGVDPRLCALVVQKKFLKKLMSLKRQNFILRYFYWLVCGNLYDSLTYGGAKSTVTRVDSYENKLVSQNALSTHKRGVCSRDAIMGFLSLQYPGKGWVFINP